MSPSRQKINITRIYTKAQKALLQSALKNRFDSGTRSSLLGRDFFASNILSAAKSPELAFCPPFTTLTFDPQIVPAQTQTPLFVTRRCARKLPLRSPLVGITKVWNGHKNGLASESWHREFTDRFRWGELRLPSQWPLALSQCGDDATIRT